MAKSKINSKSLVLSRAFSYELDGVDVSDIVNSMIDAAVSDWTDKKMGAWPERVAFRNLDDADDDSLHYKLNNEQEKAIVELLFPAVLTHNQFYELGYALRENEWDNFEVPGETRVAVFNAVRAAITPVMQGLIAEEKARNEKNAARDKAEEEKAEQQQVERAVALLRKNGFVVERAGAVTTKVPQKRGTINVKMGAVLKTAKRKPTAADVLKLDSFRQLVVAAARIQGCEPEGVYKNFAGSNMRIKLYNVGSEKQCRAIGLSLAAVGLTNFEVDRLASAVDNSGKKGWSLTIRIPTPRADDWGYFESVQKSFAAKMA